MGGLDVMEAKGRLQGPLKEGTARPEEVALTSEAGL